MAAKLPRPFVFVHACHYGVHVAEGYHGSAPSRDPVQVFQGLLYVDTIRPIE